MYRLFRVFIRLQKTCSQARVSFSSDRYRDGDIHMSLTVRTPRNGDKAPRRRGHQSRSQGGRPGTWAPTPETPETPTPAPAPERRGKRRGPAPAPAPTPVRRGRRRGPAAAFRDERRRHGRIESDVLLPTPAPPAPALTLASREKVGALALPGPRPIIILAHRKREGAHVLPPRPLPSPGYPWREITLPLSFSWPPGKG